MDKLVPASYGRCVAAESWDRFRCVLPSREQELDPSFCDFFDVILNKAGVVCTPGAGFGSCGTNYIRFSSFNTYENTVEAMERFKNIL